jgi:hypothetical protein
MEPQSIKRTLHFFLLVHAQYAVYPSDAICLFFIAKSLWCRYAGGVVVCGKLYCILNCVLESLVHL